MMLLLATMLETEKSWLYEYVKYVSVAAVGHISVYNLT
jgi:hypothetical protein